MIDWKHRRSAGALTAGMLAIIAATLITYFATKRSAVASAATSQETSTEPSVQAVVPVRHSYGVETVARPAPAAIASVAPTMERKQPSAAEIRESVEQSREKYLGRYRAEVPDPSWSATEETRISGRLASMKSKMKLSVAVDEIACRSTICLVTLRWPSWETGQRERRNFVSQLSGDEGCGHFIYMPPRDNESGEFSTQLILDCESQRTGDTPGVPLNTEVLNGTHEDR
jgi:hypothetical protein